MIARFHKRIFHFKQASGTSRGVLTEKLSWFIELTENNVKGVGECSIISGLSPDFEDEVKYELKIQETVEQLNTGQLTYENAPQLLAKFPSILFGVETAFLDLKNGGKGLVFENDFSSGKQKIPINGLIWMGSESFMLEQIEQKVEQGFSTLKMKVGAIDFDTEFKILQAIRSKFPTSEMTLRVDANGAFDEHSALKVLQQLSELEIHSMEQPIKPNQWKAMQRLCQVTPTPIALDEELIGITEIDQKIQLLETIQPQFIILKPSLHGGISGCREWISIAEKRNIPWWMTSALESNIGLNAICQFTAEFKNNLPQGLGTGSLYVDNIDSDLVVENGFIFKDARQKTLD